MNSGFITNNGFNMKGVFGKTLRSDFSRALMSLPFQEYKLDL